MSFSSFLALHNKSYKAYILFVTLHKVRSYLKSIDLTNMLLSICCQKTGVLNAKINFSVFLHQKTTQKLKLL